MSTRTRHFEQSSRNWVMALAVFACFSFAAFGYYQGAPWYFLLIVGLPGIAGTASWLASERGGYTVTPTQLRFYQGQDWDLSVRPEQVLFVDITADSEGPDRVTLHLQNGSSRELPDFCVGRVNELDQALRDVGIDVRRRRS